MEAAILRCRMISLTAPSNSRRRSCVPIMLVMLKEFDRLWDCLGGWEWLDGIVRILNIEYWDFDHSSFGLL